MAATPSSSLWISSLCDFAESVSYLAERSGVDLQFEGGGDPDAARERSLRRRTIHKALAAATVYYHKYLLNLQLPGSTKRPQLPGRPPNKAFYYRRISFGVCAAAGCWRGFVAVAAKLGHRQERA